jgi:hypothetical protein
LGERARVGESWAGVDRGVAGRHQERRFRLEGVVRDLHRPARVPVHPPVSPDEEAANLDLIRWFRRRYPTAAERLAYVRRAYARWTTALPDGGSASPPLKR